MNNRIGPLNERDRIYSIDILRGFSILGIFLVNMPSFFTPILYIDESTWWDQRLDQFLHRLVDIFAQASFYPLFSFLFGFGAVLLYERIKERGGSFPLIFSRRLFALLAFGCAHAFFVWHGDILINYALFGFVFLLFYRMKGKTLLITGAIMYLLPSLVFGGLFILAYAMGGGADLSLTDQVMIDRSIEVYQGGTFAEITEQRFEDWYLVNNFLNGIIMFFSIFPLFLLGAGFAKLKWLENSLQHHGKLFALMIASFVSAMGLKWLPYYTSETFLSGYIQDQFGGPLLSLFYITAITLLLHNEHVAKRLTAFAYVGRLSMSNYLFQSTVSSFLFYSYGFGLYGKISFTAGFILTIVIFFLQIALSKLWIEQYRYGPIEYVWRIMTYGKKPVMKRRNNIEKR